MQLVSKGMNIFNKDVFWDEGSATNGGNEGFQYYGFPVENGSYIISTNVIDNAATNIASVMATDRFGSPTSGGSGVFNGRPRTLKILTGYIYIYIRNRSSGYLTWTKETFAPYYVKIEPLE